MILEKEQRTITQNTQHTKIAMGIDAKDMVYVFEALSSPYSDEIAAVIREYSWEC